MAKSLKEHSEEEMNKIVDDLAAFYEKHEHPKWLGAPKIYYECVNILNAGQQQKQQVFRIEGKAPIDQQENAKKMTEELNQILANVQEKEIEVGCSFGVGTKMGVIADANKVYIDEQPVEGVCEVKHEAGQVLLLDFWATWCPPCQKPMAHNQEMLEKRGADWGKDVRLIGLSIDQDVNKLKSHVADKKWTKVEHYHVANGKCKADNEYGVQGVPHVLLVDKEGTIVFMGHPASRNIEKDIDALLKGEKLTGDGTQAAGGEGSADEKVASQDEVDKFMSGTKEWVESMKDKCQKFQRAFLVMTNDQHINMKDKSRKNVATIHTVLVGPKDELEAVKAECEKFSKGNWENRNQVIPQ